MQEEHYYPFGLNQVGDWYATTAPENKYQFNGKELNEEMGLNWGTRDITDKATGNPMNEELALIIERMASKAIGQGVRIYHHKLFEYYQTQGPLTTEPKNK